MGIRESIAQVLAARGPDKETVELTYCGITAKYTFRVLPYLEIDRLRTYSAARMGGIDQSRIIGNNARWVAAALVDDDGGSFTEEVVQTWPTAYIDMLAKAAAKINEQDSTVEDKAKNSDAVERTGT